MQLFGADEDKFVEAALKCETLGASIVDINMGCSVNCVSGRGAGAGLLREPQKIGRLFNKLSCALKIPITGKIRLGWDDDALNYIDVARTIEDNGGSLVAIHGRTKMQLYKGNARWQPIAEVKRAVKIPVVGNGDVKTVADIARIKNETGCDGVMIGRAAIGNPWIFSRKDREDVTLNDITTLLRRHLRAMLDYYGEHGLILFRKHAVKYLLGLPHATDLRAKLVTCDSVNGFYELIAQYERGEWVHPRALQTSELILV
jgi:nifR3 family TIM-barrel protein